MLILLCYLQTKLRSYHILNPLSLGRERWEQLQSADGALCPICEHVNAGRHRRLAEALAQSALVVRRHIWHLPRTRPFLGALPNRWGDAPDAQSGQSMNPQSNAKVRDALAIIFGGIEKLQAAFGN